VSQPLNLGDSVNSILMWLSVKQVVLFAKIVKNVIHVLPRIVCIRVLVFKLVLHIHTVPLMPREMFVLTLMKKLLVKKLIKLFIESQYLLKAFYDTTTTNDEVVALVGTVTETGSPNFQTNGYYWSYIPGKRVLGGSLVWYKAKFVKSFSVPDPHYAVHVRMSVILGDGMTGNFYYSFPTLSNITVTTGNTGNLASLWGKATNEKTIPLDFTVPHSTSTFSVTLHCESVAANIYDGFCAVSDYFLVVNYVIIQFNLVCSIL